ncbi:MAG: pectate lyase [Fuerstiella sp.]
MFWIRSLLLFCPLWITASLIAADPDRDGARRTIDQAARYFSQHVSVHGGYVYFYSPDLKRRLGEGVASPTQIWVQPPGTPTVGMACLDAWEATGDDFLLSMATAAADALIYGQLKSGAWTNSIDFDTAGATAQYRNGKGRGRNFSTLDDGISQAALQLLMRVDRAHEFNNRSVHEAAQIALDALLKAQFDNGAFPQGWDETAVDTQQPVIKASYPDYDWRTEGRIKEYWDMYTLNDGAAGTIATTLILAHDVYGAARCQRSLKKLGDFLRLAQMPDPQPAWAQQYSFAMHPIWARKFEPPAVAGRESQDVIETLLRIYQATGDARYLQPIPDALNYLRRSRLPDGRLARYYELQTNRPLYMQRSGQTYTLTHDDSRLPDHYGWKVENRLTELESEYRRLLKDGPVPRQQTPPTTAEVQQIIAAADSEGRWISQYQGERLIGQAKFRVGDDYLSSEVFSTNVRRLSAYLQATSP